MKKLTFHFGQLLIAASHIGLLMDVLKQIMVEEQSETETIRLVGHDLASGGHPDMAHHNWNKDESPILFPKVSEANPLIDGTRKVIRKE